MSSDEIRIQAAAALARHGCQHGWAGHFTDFLVKGQVDAVLAAVEPLIRADERERLAKMAGGEYAIFAGVHMDADFVEMLSYWIRAQGGEQANAQAMADALKDS